MRGLIEPQWAVDLRHVNAEIGKRKAIVAAGFADWPEHDQEWLRAHALICGTWVYCDGVSHQRLVDSLPPTPYPVVPIVTDDSLETVCY